MKGRSRNGDGFLLSGDRQLVICFERWKSDMEEERGRDGQNAGMGHIVY